MYFAEFRALGGTWRPRAYYEKCRADFAATAKRLWRERRAVPLVTWHLQNPYVPVMWKDRQHGSDCGMRYRFGCEGYPEEHRNVLREIVNGTGGECGFGRIDGRNERTFPNPRAWFEWVLQDLAAFCRTLVDEKGRRIPIVWRPFHEMDGGWFWWGQGHAEPKDLIAAYRLFVDIMSRELGRENMLVCYSPDRRWEGLGKVGESGFLTWYPGNDYADFIGWDDYGIGAGDTEKDRLANAQKTLERMRIVTKFARENDKVCGIWESGNRMFGANAKDRPGFYRTLHELATAPGVAFSVMTTYDGPCTFPNTDAGKREMAEFLASPDVLVDDWNGKVRVAVDATNVVCAISPWLYGTGMEDVNHEIYGGLDAQRLFGESFEEPPPRHNHDVSANWDKAEAADGADFIYDRKVFHQGRASQSLVPNGGIAAIANAGLRRWGVPCRAGKKMVGYLWTRGKVDRMEVALQDFWGEKTYAVAEIPLQAGTNWCRAAFALTPAANDAHGRFVIRAIGTGKVWVDDVYLADEPTNAFGRIGCREDIAAAFQDEGVTFLRWGGSMVNCPEYALRNMDGRGARKPYLGYWYRESSGGFGPYEFVRMANAMRLPCSVAISAYDTVEDAVKFATELKAFDTPVFVQIGNEEIVNWTKNPPDSRTMKGVTNYCAAVRRLVPAMRAANPKLKFIQSAMVMGHQQEDLLEAVFRGVDGVVEYWDVHVNVVEPKGVRKGIDHATLAWTMIRKWNPKTTMKVIILEENGNNHGLDRALAHAVMLEKARAMGPDMLTTCPANALQPYLHNENWWDQGAIFFTPTQVWLSPCGQLQKLASAHHRELLVKGSTDSEDVSVSATKSRDGASLVLHFVNTAMASRMVSLKLSGADGMKVRKVMSLSGTSVKADNSPREPLKVAPKDDTADFLRAPCLRPYSYTVVVLERP